MGWGGGGVGGGGGGGLNKGFTVSTYYLEID